MEGPFIAVVGLFEAAVDYVTARLRLEGRRLEKKGTSLLVWVLTSASAVALVLLGLIFFSFGVAAWLSARLGSPPAGLLIVGAFYIVLGIIVVSIVGRRRGGPSGS